MAKRFAFKKIFLMLASLGIVGISQHASAAAFQLWEQDAASIGNYHAGVAAIAEDASTAFYNPAGLIRIKNQQFVAGGDAVVADIRFNGTVGVNTLFPQTTPLTLYPASAQGGGFAAIPFLHYAAPITDNIVFGFSIDVPFGAQTNYGQNTMLRYAATKSSIQVVDFTPSLGFAFNEKFSAGIGLDIQRMNGEFDTIAVAIDPTMDSVSNNSGSDTAYGFHGGLLYQYSPTTRMGLAYHSQVVHHLNGTSKLLGPLANYAFDPTGVQQSNDFTADMPLPPMTSLSLFQTINPAWDVMASITYVRWSVFKNFILKNVAGIDQDPTSGSFYATNSLQVNIYEGYHNAWNYAFGANYHPNDRWTLRTGIGFDQTPSVNEFRSVQLPDSDRIALALGLHFQATKTLGFDLGWTHLFILNTTINNLVQPIGAETVTTNGNIHSAADVYGAQLKWDIV